jgi:hypothetical protein
MQRVGAGREHAGKAILPAVARPGVLHGERAVAHDTSHIVSASADKAGVFSYIDVESSCTCSTGPHGAAGSWRRTRQTSALPSVPVCVDVKHSSRPSSLGVGSSSSIGVLTATTGVGASNGPSATASAASMRGVHAPPADRARMRAPIVDGVRAIETSWSSTRANPC